MNGVAPVNQRFTNPSPIPLKPTGIAG